MNIRYLRPRAGRPFQLQITNFAGRVAYTVFLGSSILRRADCPDPPCHEVLLLSTSSETQRFMISVAHQSHGSAIPQVFEIPLVVGRSEDPELWEERVWEEELA